jgi:hypothetical protein
MGAYINEVEQCCSIKVKIIRFTMTQNLLQTSGQSIYNLAVSNRYPPHQIILRLEGQIVSSSPSSMKYRPF